MRCRMWLQAVEPLRQEMIPGHLGTTDRSTRFHRKIGPRNSCSYESSRPSLTRTVSASSCSTKSSSKTCLTHQAEVSIDELERYTGKSSET